jgi:hypothetical protein
MACGGRSRRRPPTLMAILAISLVVTLGSRSDLGPVAVAEAASSSSNSEQSSGRRTEQQSATTTYGTRAPRPPVGSPAAQTNARDTAALKAAAAARSGPAAGRIDESERAFLPKERRTAQTLAAEGKQVKSLKESKQQGIRNADALVDGELTELKQLSPGASADTVRNIVSKSTKGQGQQPNSGQARRIIVDARDSGLTEVQAMEGLDKVRALESTRGRLDSVRIIGDGFDRTDGNFN